MAGDGILQNGTGDESAMASLAASDVRQSSNLPARKLGFGLVGSGKRTAVLSVFHEEEDDDAHKEKKMRPLVPIDYSTEELQAVQPTISGPSPSNLVAAAEFAKRITNVKDDKSDIEKERNRRAYDRSSHRDRNDEDINRARDENREKFLDRDRDREHGPEKLRTPDNKKLLDAKQLIDMIPKTKEELFSYEINWGVYDKVSNVNSGHDSKFLVTSLVLLKHVASGVIVIFKTTSIEIFIDLSILHMHIYMEKNVPVYFGTLF